MAAAEEVREMTNSVTSPETLSDSEEIGDCQERVPPEVRAARRSAAAALAVSLVVFCAVAALALHTFAGGAVGHASAPAVAPALVSSPMAATVALSETSERLRAEFGGGVGRLSNALRTCRSSPLYQDSSMTSPQRRQLPEGQRVYPVKHVGSWVQVIVPGHGDEPPASGWLLSQSGGTRPPLLEREPLVPAAPRTRAPPPPREELERRWDEVRAKNAQLKQTIAGLQDAVRQRYTDSLRSTQQDATDAVVQTASSAIDFQALHNEVLKLRDQVGKELRVPPQEILNDISKALE